ncbi:MAG: LLM class F420-dependent oxidoreductase [Candidatus Binatia bacterium]|nr:MAG: LLM class F420-dependent oxidoreductase [Candidatus Binatia bacterium]
MRKPRKTKVGLFFPQVGVPFPTMRERVVYADRLGYDSVWVVDHMWARGIPDVDHLEAFTVMTALAAATERIRVGALVFCNSYRNPALLAKMLSSLDVVSGGRTYVGIGAGWMEEEYRAYGYPFPPARVRIEQLEEAVTILKKMFTEPRATFEGKYYAVQDAANNPKPVQKPHPPLLIGGAGERRLLRVVAQHADIWNCPNNAAPEFERKLGALRRHCDAVGRDFEEIEISEQCVAVLGKDEKDFRRQWEAASALLGSVFDLEKTAFRGTPPQLVEQFRRRREQGVTFFTVLFSDFHSAETLDLFAREVLPHLD